MSRKQERSIRHRALAVATLTLLAVAGNACHVRLFFGVDFVFGGIAVLVAARLLGAGWGAAVALVSSSYTYLLWQHPYGIPIFTAEAVVVGALARRGRVPLLAADALYWVVAGVPLAWLLHGEVMGFGPDEWGLIALKNGVNGVLDALLASLAVNHLPLARWIDGASAARRPSLREVLFTVLVATVLVPATFLMAGAGRREKERLEVEAVAALRREGDEVAALLRSWFGTRAQAVRALAARVEADGPPVPSEALQRTVQLVQDAFPDFAGIYVADADAVVVAGVPERDAEGRPFRGLRYADRDYYRHMKATGRPYTSDVFLARGVVRVPVVAVGAPIRAGGRFAGYALGGLDLRPIAEHLALHRWEGGGVITVLDRGGRIIASTEAARRPMSVYDWTAGGYLVAVGGEVWRRVPAEPLPGVLRWKRSHFVHRVAVGGDAPLEVLVEQPLAPLQDRLFGLYLEKLRWMLVISMLATLVMLPVSHWLVRPLRRLATATTNLPARLLEGGDLSWPAASSREVERLVRNFQAMTEVLAENFRRLRERNAHLAEVNRELEREMAERERLEAEIRQVQKMESLGTFAGGIAHDFNNLLAGILGYADVMAEELPPDSPFREDLDEIRRAGLRARDLVRQILTFSRRQDPEWQPVDLRAVLDETLAFLRPTLPATIEIRTRFAPEVGWVQGDRSQLQQVVLNLCANAEQALRSGGGVLELALDVVDLDERTARGRSLAISGPCVRLTVADDGPGVEPSVLPRIFEPFFTTKAVGQGTGMGLAMVHGIVTRHRGAIVVDSAPGRGARFEVYLPRATAAASRTTEPPAGRPTGTERILVVDDEPIVARVACRALRRQGYRVETFTDPVAALERVRARPDTVDLVLTDQTMPGMTGDALMRALRAVRPDLPIILCSGNSELADGAGADAFVAKPLTADELARAVRQVLDGARSAAA